MRAPSVQRPAVLAEAGYFIDDILAIALDVSVGNQRTSRHLVFNHHGSEQFPLLARVKVAIDPRQVPGQRPIHLRMEQ